MHTYFLLKAMSNLFVSYFVDVLFVIRTIHACGTCLPSAGIRVGGRDGLVDPEEEEMDGVDDSPEVLNTAEDDEINIVGYRQSPGYSSFRFRPSAASTVDRRSAPSGRKENSE